MSAVKTAGLLFKIFSGNLVFYDQDFKSSEFKLFNKNPAADPKNRWPDKILIVSLDIYGEMSLTKNGERK